MPELSLIVCTRNPAPALLARVLRALCALRVPRGWARAAVLIDNGSHEPIRHLPAVHSVLQAHPWWRVVEEPCQGLAYARVAGATASQGELLVWFDDDTEPEPDYLEGVVSVATRVPDALVFGAGRIVVEYVDPVSRWLRRYGPPFHLQRETAEGFSRATVWTDVSPFGAGLVTRRVAIDHWIAERAAGRYTLDGRSGSRLSAGEDAELQFAAIRLGGSTGVSPLLSLRHLIPAVRTSLRYLARLEYGTSGSVHCARAEVFGTAVLPALGREGTAWRLVRTVAAATRRRGVRMGLLAAASWLGGQSGLRRAYGAPVPSWMQLLTRLLRLD